MAVELTIVCDKCGGIIAARRRRADAVADARSTGAKVSASGQRAECSPCLTRH